MGVHLHLHAHHSIDQIAQFAREIFLLAKADMHGVAMCPDHNSRCARLEADHLHGIFTIDNSNDAARADTYSLSRRRGKFADFADAQPKFGAPRVPAYKKYEYEHLHVDVRCIPEGQVQGAK